MQVQVDRNCVNNIALEEKFAQVSQANIVSRPAWCNTLNSNQSTGSTVSAVGRRVMETRHIKEKKTAWIDSHNMQENTSVNKTQIMQDVNKTILSSYLQCH